MSKIIFGIDFGTTNSCISYFNGKEYNIITNEHGNYITPTCIYFSNDSDEISFGETALSQNINCGTLIQNIKRLFGIPYNEYIKNTDLQSCFKNLHIVQDPKSIYCNITLQHDNQTISISIDIIVQKYLDWFIKHAQQVCGNSNYKCIVITVPVLFNHNQRSLMKNCLKNLGFENIKIINEPTSATLAYTHIYSKKTENTIGTENVLVIDCGGGTTDFTVLEADYENMYFEVLENIGDSFLGGDDLTNNFMIYILNKIGTPIVNTKTTQTIKRACERSKRNLTFKNYDTIVLENINDKDYNINVSRSEFEMCNKAWFDTITNLLNDVYEKYTIDKIVFVGGTTVVPKIKSLILSKFPSIHLYNNLHADHTVSIGASIQAYLLFTENESELDITFVDTLSMSLGVETIGGIMTPIVSKNTMLPCSRTETFTTTDNEPTIDITVYQGERRFVKDNLLLGTFTIQRQLTEQSSQIKIEITFDITSDGLLIVTARNSQNDQEMTVVVNYTKHIDESYIYTDDFDKINDTELSNLIKSKIELNNTFQLLKKIGETDETEPSEEYKHLIDTTKTIIDNYTQYNIAFLQNYKTTFEQRWHQLQKQFNKGI